MNQKNKRPRAPKTETLVKEANHAAYDKDDKNVFNVEKFKEQHPVENSYNEWYDENGNFMWDEYAASCPSVLGKANPHIKTRNGDKVYSRASYAQELYDKMAGHMVDQNIIT